MARCKVFYFTAQMLCSYTQTSYFKDVFEPVRDFNWNYPIELPEDLQKIYDPVGFWYFHKRNVNPILQELRLINKRVNLRDLLRDMDRIWRFNNQNHLLLNEPDWLTDDQVAGRVNAMTHTTRARLKLANRAENQVSSHVIRTWEYQEPVALPVLAKGTLSGELPFQTPRIMLKETVPLFAPVSSYNKKVYFQSTPAV